MIWIVFVVLTALVMAALLAPLWRHPQAAPARADYDRAVFRDQLAELDRDLSRGVIAPAEAEAARNEISRRVIAAAAETPRAASRSPLLALVAVLLVPLIALPLYWSYGNPLLPDVPRAQRLANAVANKDMEAMLAQVEQHLEAQPNDISGWRVLAPAYRGEGRFDDAANAYARILELGTPDAETLTDYGEMLLLANQGTVTPDASRAFAQALRLDPGLPRARFYAAIEMKQKGKADDAKAMFEALLKDSPAQAPWRPMVEAQLRSLGSTAPQLSQDQMTAGGQMAPGDQQAMIRGMVDGLEAKLKADGDNLDGWLRLIRARSVLNEPDKAKAALATARTQFKDRPDALSQLDGLAKEVGLN